MGGDPAAGEVLEVEAVPQLGEQGGLLRKIKGGALGEKPRSLLSGWRTPSSGRPPTPSRAPGAITCIGDPALHLLRRPEEGDGAAVTGTLSQGSRERGRPHPPPSPGARGAGRQGQGGTKLQAFQSPDCQHLDHKMLQILQRTKF